jgi:HD-GYP domain-containing protein (c-di-GMP phosphodiesterase class II)
VLKLEYSVDTLDKTPLLPAGAVLTRGTLEKVALHGPCASFPSAPLMEYGTVRRDILRFIREGTYRIIFDDQEENADLFRHIEKLRLPRPLLDALGYFRRHDPYTYRHSLAVFALSTLLARDLLGNDPDAFLEATAGPVHDFGKICVPLRILRKTTSLCRPERAFLEHHTLAGYVLLGYYLKDPTAVAAKVALEHHERRDGSGYPLGIRLSDRLVELVAACDVYDALISQRPYRRVSYDNRTALEEVTAMGERGQIGWDIVRALVAHNRKNRPRVQQCAVSVEKRGKPPEGNLYGVFAEDGSSKRRE